MYHYLSKIVYSYGYGLTSGFSTYSLLCYCNIGNEPYWERIFNGKIISTSVAAFTLGCYLGFRSNPKLKCLIPYQYVIH